LAKQLLGWSPKVDLAEGLKATADYFAGELARGREPARALAAAE
jgi:nucleoside-diphosphate-sugar epimerase